MTVKRTPRNEKAKRDYLIFLRDAKGRDDKSIDQVAAAIDRFDEYNRRRDFAKFHIEQARGFKAHLSARRNVRTGEPLSASTVNSTLGMVKAFFIWLSGQEEYHRHVRQADAEYFNPPDSVSRVATARRHKPCASLKQIRAVLDAMPMATEIERRDRALVAFTILTGARDRAIVSFRLKDIDLEHELLEQDARHARTKGAKTFTTWFFPVGADIQKIVADWVTFLRSEKGFGPEDPIFPKTRVDNGPDMQFRPDGLERAPWANANPVRAIFKEAFARAGLPYFNPHSFRNSLVQLDYELKLTAEQFKAWSQNLGHDDCLTTFSSYGTLPPYRQAEIIRGLANPAPAQAGGISPDLLRQWAEQMERANKTSG
jgi:integrase